MPSIPLSPALGGTGQVTTNPRAAAQKGSTGLVPPGSFTSAKYWRSWFVTAPGGIMRGEPAPLSNNDRRTLRERQPEPAPFGYVRRHASREYTRPVDSMTWSGGVLTYNPIGAGVVYTDKLNVFPRAVGDYVAGQIFWNTTPINFARQPVTGPLLTPQQSYGLFGTSTPAVIPQEQYESLSNASGL